MSIHLPGVSRSTLCEPTVGVYQSWWPVKGKWKNNIPWEKVPLERVQFASRFDNFIINQKEWQMAKWIYGSDHLLMRDDNEEKKPSVSQRHDSHRLIFLIFYVAVAITIITFTTVKMSLQWKLGFKTLAVCFILINCLLFIFFQTAKFTNGRNWKGNVSQNRTHPQTLPAAVYLSLFAFFEILRPQPAGDPCLSNNKDYR